MKKLAKIRSICYFVLALFLFIDVLGVAALVVLDQTLSHTETTIYEEIPISNVIKIGNTDIVVGYYERKSLMAEVPHGSYAVDDVVDFQEIFTVTKFTHHIIQKQIEVLNGN